MKRADGIPADAEFFEDWNEWGLGERKGQKKVGHWRFWRPDGTFVEESEWVDGKLHGPKVRFHDDGSHSEVAEYVNGEMVKCAFHRTDNPTQENTHVFANAPEAIRIAEFWYSAGFQVAQKLRNREGVEIDYTGDPLPSRTKGIPETACWHPNEELWTDGKWHGRKPKRFGLWRIWSADGDIQKITYYHEGKDLAAIGDIEESHGSPLIEAERLQDREAVEQLLKLGLASSPGAAHHAAFEGMPELCLKILSWDGEILFPDQRASLGERPEPPPENAVWVAAMESWLAGEIDQKTGQAIGQWRQWYAPSDCTFITCKTALFCEGKRVLLQEYRDNFETLTASLAINPDKTKIERGYDELGRLKEETKRLRDGKEIFCELFANGELKSERTTSPDGAIHSKCYYPSKAKRGEYRLSADEKHLDESWLDEEGRLVMQKRLVSGAPLCEVFDETGKQIAKGQAKRKFGGVAIGEWHLSDGTSAHQDLNDLEALEVDVDDHARDLIAWLTEPPPDELTDCDDVEWDELDTFFGSAEPFPFWLKGLSLNNEWVFDSALNSLWDPIFHQGTVCEAGGPAITRMVRLFERIQNEELLEKLADFVLRCATRDYSIECSQQVKSSIFGEDGQAFFAEDSQDAFGSIYHAIASASKTGMRLLNSDRPKSRISGATMLALSNQQEANDALLEVFSTADEQLRSEILHLFRLFTCSEKLEAILDETLRSSVDLERFCAALTSIHIRNESLRQASLSVLEQALEGKLNTESYAELLLADEAPIASALRKLPSDNVVDYVSLLCELFDKANAIAAINIADALLDIVFPNDAYDGEELKPHQKQVIAAIAASDQAWVFNVNLHEVLRYNGLPTDREELRQLGES